MVLILALAFDPRELDGKVRPTYAYTGNKFYEFSQIRHQLLVAGQTRQVKKIMTYNVVDAKQNDHDSITVLYF